MKPVAVVLLSLASAACNSLHQVDPAEVPPPNIIAIVADDLGYGDLGCYGQKDILTPSLDRMAAEGMRFTNFYAGSTVCAPSRATLMTGLHTGHTSIRGNNKLALKSSTVTMADILKSAGYRTGLIGKWGLGDVGSTGEPNLQGFDYFYGYLNQTHAHNYYPEFLFRNRDQVPLGNILPEPKREDGAGVAIKKRHYSHDLIAEEALQFVSKEEPFFLALMFTIPHANNEALSKGMEVPDYGVYTHKDWTEARKGHAAMISRMDADIGKLLAKLRKIGADDNTVVLFTSDNGPHREGGYDPTSNNSNGLLRGIKRDLYEGGIRVPLIARWINRIAPGSVSDRIGAFWDLLPTFAEFAGADTPDGLDGISMAGTLVGSEVDSDDKRFLYWEFHEGEASKQAIRVGNWKGVRLAPNKPIELYNVDKDLGETTDVASTNLDVVHTIEQYLQTARTESESYPLRLANSIDTK